MLQSPFASFQLSSRTFSGIGRIFLLLVLLCGRNGSRRFTYLWLNTFHLKLDVFLFTSSAIRFLCLSSSEDSLNIAASIWNLLLRLQASFLSAKLEPTQSFLYSCSAQVLSPFTSLSLIDEAIHFEFGLYPLQVWEQPPTVHFVSIASNFEFIVLISRLIWAHYLLLVQRILECSDQIRDQFVQPSSY